MKAPQAFDFETLRQKYPGDAGLIKHAPNPGCKYCHGTGEVRTKSKQLPLRPCLCLMIEYKIAERMQDALNRMAREEQARLRGGT